MPGTAVKWEVRVARRCKQEREDKWAGVTTPDGDGGHRCIPPGGRVAAFPAGMQSPPDSVITRDQRIKYAMAQNMSVNKSEDVEQPGGERVVS